jgi:hypothetical protein
LANHIRAVRTESGCFEDLGDGTVVDTCTGLQWEKKHGADGIPGNGAANPGDLHDVDNHYVWHGRCTINSLKLCQPSADAETACRAQTEPAFWGVGCQQCAPGEGVCVPPSAEPGAVTTVWEWLAGLNAARFAGHDDWRIPTVNKPWEPGAAQQPEELRTLLRWAEGSCAGGDGACISPILGPTANAYWSATTYAAPGLHAMLVYLTPSGPPSDASGFYSSELKTHPHSVRAVRDAGQG